MSKALLVTVALLTLSVAVHGEFLVYSNDFEVGPVGPEWSSSATDVTPGTASHPADRFLGQFGNENVTLTIGLPAGHTEVRVEFDLYVIRTWDGNFDADARGPDFWAFELGPAPTDPADWDFITTFSNWDPATGPRQAYPDVYGVGDYPARTGAAENNTLGFLYNPGTGPIILDAVYESTAPAWSHTAGTLTITMGADHLQSVADESWGIDNVAVYVDIPEPTSLVLCVLAGVLHLRRR